MALTTAVLIFLLVLKVDPITVGTPQFAGGGDHLIYHEMATGQTKTTVAPFCYRILVPGLVRVLPCSAEAGFFFQTLVFLWGAGLVMFLVLRELGESPIFAWSGIVLFFGLNWAGKFTVWDFWLTDPALFFFGIAAFFATLRNNIPLLVVSLTLGCLAKEAMIFLLPLYYGYHARKFLDWPLAGKTILIGLLPLGLMLTLRAAIHPTNQYDLGELFLEMGIPKLSTTLKTTVLGFSTGTWGVPTLIMAMLGFWHDPRLRRTALFFLPFVYLQPLFANNLDRLLVFGFIVVIPLAVAGLRWFAQRYRLAAWMTIGYAALPFLFLLMKNGYHPWGWKLQLIVVGVWSLIVMVARKISIGSTTVET